MSNTFLPARSGQGLVITITAALVAGSIIPASGIEIDRYGNSHVTLQDMADTSYAQWRASADAYKRNSQHPSDSGVENVFAKWAAELQAKEDARKEAANQAAARKKQEAIDAKERVEREDRIFRAQLEAIEKEARMNAEIKERERVRAAERFERFYGEIVRKSTACLNAFRAGTPMPKEGTEKVAQVMLSGTFEGTPLAEIGLNYPESERYALALEIYRQRNAPFESHAWSAVTAHVALGQLGNLIDATDDVYPFADDSTGAHGFYWAPLACALADKNNRLNPDQRRLAIELLTAVVNSLPVQTDEDGMAQARLLVAAAENTPEIAQMPRLHSALVPLVRRSIWAQGYTKPLAQPSVPITVGDCGLTNGLWMALAQELVLSRRNEYPQYLLAKIRMLRRREKAGVPSEAQFAFLQNALDGWMKRTGFDRRLQGRLQKEFEFTVSGGRGQLDNRDLARWDQLLTDNRVSTLRDPQYQMVRLYGQDPLHTGVTTFLMVAGPEMMSTYIDFACEDPKKLARREFSRQQQYDEYLADFARNAEIDIRFRSKSAFDQLTSLALAEGGKLSDLGISKARWNDLVAAGETSMRLGNEEWNEPATVAKLAQVRRDILGESGAALARPKYSTKPAQAGRVLASLVPSDNEGIDPAIREEVNSLLYQCRDTIAPSTVLTVARIRGPVLGDWVRLAAWLDDPRRRPNNEKDPLHAIYVAAIIERDLSAGLLGDVPAGPAEVIAASERLQKWLNDVLASNGAARAKLISENFPGVIHGTLDKNSHPNLQLLGYDVMRGGLASRALLLLSTPEFDPTEKLLYSKSYDAEPWLSAVARLPRTVTPEALVAELAANVKAPGITWVSEGSQAAIVRLAYRWSPARAPAHAAILELGEKLALPSANDKATVACIGARVRWEQAKMRGLDDADAFGEAAGPLYPDELKVLARLAQAETKPSPLILARDSHFSREANEAAKRPAVARARPGRPERIREAMNFAKLVIAYRKKAYSESEQLRKSQVRDQLTQEFTAVLSADACATLFKEDERALATYTKAFLIGTRARLAAIGSANAEDWLLKIEALPEEVDQPELASALVAAVHARLRPEDITTELLYTISDEKRSVLNMTARLAVRALLEEPEAQRYFGLTWPSESSIPFKAEWMLEMLDQQMADTVTDEFVDRRTEEQTALAAASTDTGGFMGQDRGDAVLRDYLAARHEKQMRERVRRLTPKVAMAFAYSAKSSKSELVRTLLRDGSAGFIDSLARIAAEEEPSLQPLLDRFKAGGVNWKPLTVGQWELLADGRLWPIFAIDSSAK